ncbi:hypothetical protein FISHEDRAFT_79024 [Fistulina hepatica ATCC 64428]|uniref:Uncharacterized protein n=1 Tax=Fistulina hepatica ATCC 64428 TaxID=1128425 RepID=A0A0D6ZZF6_9AGAR|nr:hypothetical protein FISHEDRAFT_79024 [Fistulina hepatica ATCC 64428]
MLARSLFPIFPALVAVMLFAPHGTMAKLTILPDETFMRAALLYIPNTKVANVIFTTYAIVSCLLIQNSSNGDRVKWLIERVGYAVGMYGRPPPIKDVHDFRVWFILQQIFIAYSSTSFLAFNYIVYRLLVVNCVGVRHSWVRPTRVVYIFLSSDIITFLVQAAGSSLLVIEHTVAGHYIFFVGLVLQSASVKREGIATDKEIWWKAVWLLGASSIPILVRCVFRCIQIGLGRTNILSTDEVFFYCLDSLPLLLSIVVYVIWWPGKYVDSGADSIAEYKAYMPVMGPEADRSTMSDVLPRKYAHLPRRNNDGSNWITYKERMLNYLTSEKLRRQLLGHKQKPTMPIIGPDGKHYMPGTDFNASPKPKPLTDIRKNAISPECPEVP